MEIIRAEAKKVGLELIEKPFANSAEVQTAAESLLGSVDIILISPSNALFSALDSLLRVAKKGNIPVIGGDESAVKRGSIATYNFSNTDVGIATAEIVIKVLKGDTNPGDIPVARPPKSRLYINQEAAKEAGITFSPDLLKEAQR